MFVRAAIVDAHVRTHDIVGRHLVRKVVESTVDARHSTPFARKADSTFGHTANLATETPFEHSACSPVENLPPVFTVEHITVEPHLNDVE